MKRAIAWSVILGGLLAGLFALLRPPGAGSADLSELAPFIPATGRTWDRIQSALVLPISALAVWLLAITGLMPRIEQRLRKWLPGWMAREPVSPEQAVSQTQAMETVALAVVLAFGALHAARLIPALQAEAATDRIAPALVGLALMLGGNTIPRLRRNLIAGIRIRATLADPVVWARVHRQFGRFLVMTGVLTVAATVVDGQYGLLVAGIGVAASAVTACLAEARRRVPPLSSRLIP